jgi:hypothetical protein
MKKEYSCNIPKFEFLGIFGKCIFEQSIRNYFWAIHGQRFMLVSIVSTYCVTWDNSKAGPRQLEYYDILVQASCGNLGQVL